jgi:hypothetical protein
MSGAGGAGGQGGAMATAGAGGSGGSGAACVPTVSAMPLEPALHVPACSLIGWGSNPPTSGSHYPIWAAYQAYTTPVPRGFYVHNLEHGAVVIAYNCPLGCDDEIASLTAYLAARPADPLCVAPLTNRFVVTPDPQLDVMFAAAAWGWAFKSDCLDLPALGAFLDAHYAGAPESSCANGVDVTSPALGYPADCGVPPGG